MIAVSENAAADPQVALYTGWLVCTFASIAVVAMVGPIENEVGRLRLDAAQLFIAAGGVLLISSVAAGSLWNDSVCAPAKEPEQAFIYLPAAIWVLVRVTLGVNLGVRLVFLLNDNPKKISAWASGNCPRQMFADPLDAGQAERYDRVVRADERYGDRRLRGSDFRIFNTVSGTAGARVPHDPRENA